VGEARAGADGSRVGEAGAGARHQPGQAGHGRSMAGWCRPGQARRALPGQVGRDRGAAGAGRGSGGRAQREDEETETEDNVDQAWEFMFVGPW
jgi:hypothetical protein